MGAAKELALLAQASCNACNQESHPVGQNTPDIGNRPSAIGNEIDSKVASS